jgi:hypothetical protein
MTQSDDSREANQLAQLSPRANQEAPVAGATDTRFRRGLSWSPG